jgi:hypothetical protein
MTKLPKQIKPLFILGLPRSGTTLLQSLLDGHPQLLVGIGDSRFWGGFCRTSRWKNRETKYDLAGKFICHAMDPKGVYYQNLLSHIPHEIFFNEFRKYIDESEKLPKDYLEAFYYGLGKATGKLDEEIHYWVDKDPASEYYLKKMVSWWPDAKFIYVMRDPRDIYASYKIRDLKNERKITSIESFSFWWKKSISQVEKYSIRVGKDRFLVFRYEDLVSDQASEVKKITIFLGIQNEDTLQRPTKGHGTVPWVGNAATEEKSFTVHKNASQKWKINLTSKEISKLETMLRPEMEKHGYLAQTHRPPFALDAYLNPLYLLREIRLFLKTL